MQETLGKRIMYHRKRLHLTQDQLAEQLGVSAQAVSKWENDQSCPDISTLPRLAELFGTSTDALLGHVPVFTAEPISEKESGGDQWAFHWGSSRRGALGFAIAVLLVGMLLLTARVLQWEVGFWGIAWPCVLLVCGVMGLIRKFRFTSIACTLLGGYFLVKNLGFVTWSISSGLIFPLLLLIFGICLLCDAIHKPKKPAFTLEKGSRQEKLDFSQGDEHFYCKASFSCASRVVDLPKLSGGRIACSFGEMTVDLTGCAEIADGCDLQIACSFGETTLRVPRQYRVKCNAGASFGSIETEGTPAADARDTILLSGGISFGSFTIEYV